MDEFLHASMRDTFSFFRESVAIHRNMHREFMDQRLSTGPTRHYSSHFEEPTSQQSKTVIVRDNEPLRQFRSSTRSCPSPRGEKMSVCAREGIIPIQTSNSGVRRNQISTRSAPSLSIRRKDKLDMGKSPIASSRSNADSRDVLTLPAIDTITITKDQEKQHDAIDEKKKDKKKLLSHIAQKLHKLNHDRGLIDAILADFITQDLGVSFDDITAIPDVKRLLNEAVVLPLLLPDVFTGIREGWKGVMLYGPPGTGKTMLAKAVASINDIAFFSCSAASLVSKYRGESEKLVKVLFDAARACDTSAIIFLDEIDALVSTRGSGLEHEACRRLKSEVFAQMDGIASSVDDTARVVVLATTNCPWDVDEAMRRRLEKRIYVPLPDEIARKELFERMLRDVVYANDVDLAELATITEGYSGADIHVLCREASMQPMRRLLEGRDPREVATQLKVNELTIPNVERNDFIVAVATTKPSIDALNLGRYSAFEEYFGSQ